MTLTDMFSYALSSFLSNGIFFYHSCMKSCKNKIDRTGEQRDTSVSLIGVFEIPQEIITFMEL